MVTGSSVGDLVERGRTLLVLRRPADAEREFRAALAMDPQSVLAHAFLALALSTQGRHDEAMEAAAEAVRLEPRFWFAHHTAGQVHLAAGRHAEALRAAETTLEADPESVSAWSLLTRVHVSAERWDRAAEAARGGLAVDPQNAGLTAHLALALTWLGDPESAVATAGRAVGLDPESPGAHWARGRAALAAGDPRTAAEAFREVLRLAPDFGHARDLLTTALKERNLLYRWLTGLRLEYRGRWWWILLLPLVPPLVVLVALIAVLHWAAWVAETFVTLRLAYGRSTRLLFADGQARGALMCGVLIVAGAVPLGMGISAGSEVLGMAGAAIMALVTPVQEAWHTGSPRARAVLYGWAGLLAASVVASLVLGVATGLLSAYAALATVWIAAGVRRVL